MAARLGKAIVRLAGEANPAVAELTRRIETALQTHFPGQVFKPQEGIDELGGKAATDAIEAEAARLQAFETGTLTEGGKKILYRVEHRPADNGAPHEIRVLTPKRQAGSWTEVPALTARLHQPGALKKALTMGLARTIPGIMVNDERFAKIANELARPKTAGTPKKMPLDSINGTGLVAAGQHHRLLLETLKPFMKKGERLVGALNPYIVPDWLHESTYAGNYRNLGRNVLLVTRRTVNYSRCKLTAIENEFNQKVNGEDYTQISDILTRHNPDKDLARITIARSPEGMPTCHEITVYDPKMQTWADLMKIKLKQWYGEQHEVKVARSYYAQATRA